MTTVQAEVVVIGSGPGGATTAHVLAAHGKDVLILEEGPFLPLSSCRPFSTEEMSQKYRGGGLNPALGNTKIALAEGRCVGGGSEINSGLYHRTPAEMLERWQREFSLAETSEEDLRPHFAYCEEALGVRLPPGEPPAASRKLQRGAERLGWRSMEVPRWFRYEPSSEGGPARGTKQSMSETFVPRALADGARLMPDTRVRRLRHTRSVWQVDTVQNGRPVEICARAVFVCCGALQTPLLLRRSGITRNIGNSLAMHPTVKVVAEFPEEVNGEDMGVAAHQVKEFAPRMSFGCSISSLPHLALALSDCPGNRPKAADSWRRMAIYYAMITGPHDGRVRGVLGLPDPLIRYHLRHEDLSALATGLRHLSRLLLAAGAERVYPAIQDARPIAAEEELGSLPEALAPAGANLMTIHLFSSCPMGEDESRCATNSVGAVYGTENLFVNDASLLPTAPGVNPQGTIMGLARRNALHFLGQL